MLALMHKNKAHTIGFLLTRPFFLQFAPWLNWLGAPKQNFSELSSQHYLLVECLCPTNSDGM